MPSSSGGGGSGTNGGAAGATTVLSSMFCGGNNHQIKDKTRQDVRNLFENRNAYRISLNIGGKVA